MQVISVDENNDIYIKSNGNLSISTDLQACIEACKTAVKTILNEQIYFQGQGVPNFQVLWKSNPNYKQAEAAFRNALLKVDNVTDIVSFEYEVNNNEFSYTAVIETTFGLGTVNG